MDKSRHVYLADSLSRFNSLRKYLLIHLIPNEIALFNVIPVSAQHVYLWY